MGYVVSKIVKKTINFKREIYLGSSVCFLNAKEINRQMLQGEQNKQPSRVYAYVHSKGVVVVIRAYAVLKSCLRKRQKSKFVKQAGQKNVQMLVLYSSKNTNGKWRGNIRRCSCALCHAQSKEDKVLSCLLCACAHQHSQRNLHSIRPLGLHMHYVYAAYVTLATEQQNNNLIALGAKLNHN